MAGNNSINAVDPVNNGNTSSVSYTSNRRIKPKFNLFGDNTFVPPAGVPMGNILNGSVTAAGVDKY